MPYIPTDPQTIDAACLACPAVNLTWAAECYCLQVLNKAIKFLGKARNERFVLAPIWFRVQIALFGMHT